MGIDGGIDQANIRDKEGKPDGISEQLTGENVANRFGLNWNKKTGEMKWFQKTPKNDGEVGEVEEVREDELEVDLSGHGGGRPVLAIKKDGSLVVLETNEGEVLELPEEVTEVVDLTSGEWIVDNTSQGLQLRQKGDIPPEIEEVPDIL